MKVGDCLEESYLNVSQWGEEIDTSAVPLRHFNNFSNTIPDFVFLAQIPAEKGAEGQALDGKGVILVLQSVLGIWVDLDGGEGSRDRERDMGIGDRGGRHLVTESGLPAVMLIAQVTEGDRGAAGQQQDDVIGFVAQLFAVGSHVFEKAAQGTEQVI